MVCKVYEQPTLVAEPTRFRFTGLSASLKHLITLLQPSGQYPTSFPFIRVHPPSGLIASVP